jgi:Hemimethylated DNA-binding protein YccV like
MLTTLDRRAKQAAALAAEASGGEQGSAVLLRLGQRVVHRVLGYRGAVVGWDVGCCEDEDWQVAASAANLSAGLRCGATPAAACGMWMRAHVHRHTRHLASAHMHTPARARTHAHTCARAGSLFIMCWWM